MKFNAIKVKMNWFTTYMKQSAIASPPRAITRVCKFEEHGFPMDSHQMNPYASVESSRDLKSTARGHDISEQEKGHLDD